MKHIPANDFIIKNHAEKHTRNDIRPNNAAVLVKQQKKRHDGRIDPVKKILDPCPQTPMGNKKAE